MIGALAVAKAATAEVRPDAARAATAVGIAANARTAPPEATRAGEVAIPADAAAENDTPDRPNPNRYVMRFRLDDPRYRGFHQNNSDELRTGDAVQAENDRIRAEHRARGRDLYP
jgi:hypothetical protein